MTVARRLVQAYGLGRLDLSGLDAPCHVSGMRAMAIRHSLNLIGFRVEQGLDLALVLPQLAARGITELVIPADPHLGEWLDTARRHATVWTLDPLGFWPRKLRHGDTAEFIDLRAAEPVR
ncbi:hypothetical protein [Nocardia sp. alder85J]|uniref:hypothetical protein n=1 Tax=Nocardia sp. alder85J TaxID=2862949 RepID=UPI001CD24EC4|nr:hypothetical protein [Nocardia sp. alder85J]MCX4099143.1 hypothetical protein [Nocardia sp. alder85J]